MAFAENASFKSYWVIFLPPQFLAELSASVDKRDSDGLLLIKAWHCPGSDGQSKEELVGCFNFWLTIINDCILVYKFHNNCDIIILLLSHAWIKYYSNACSIHVYKTHTHAITLTEYMLYCRKIWWGIKFGGLVDRPANHQIKVCQYLITYIILDYMQLQIVK